MQILFDWYKFLKLTCEFELAINKAYEVQYLHPEL